MWFESKAPTPCFSPAEKQKPHKTEGRPYKLHTITKEKERKRARKMVRTKNDEVKARHDQK